MPTSRPAPRRSSTPPSETEGYGYVAGDLIAEKYRLIRVLGEGGMGLVWVAKNEVLDIHVAIKLLGKGRTSNRSKAAQRMQQEARTAAQLGHPAICRALDFGETSRGDPFLVTELMHGESLADVLEAKTRIPAPQAVRFLLPIVEGLSSAHARGIIHRDVKPDNIFLARDLDGRVQPKLLDFGVARFVESDTKLTVDGALLGTPAYMSPEQARGKGGVDARSDVWSLCVVMYEAVTGQAPFTGDNYNQVLWSIANESPTSILEHGAGDASLWRVLKRGLEGEPDKRWQTIWEMGEALALWAYERDVRDDICGTSLRTTWLESTSSSTRVELPDSVAPGLSRQEQTGDAPDSADTIRPGPADAEGATLEGKSVTERLLLPTRRRVAFALLGSILVICGVGIGLGLSTGRDARGPALPGPVRVPAAQALDAASVGMPGSQPLTSSAPAPTVSAAPPEGDAGAASEQPTRRAKRTAHPPQRRTTMPKTKVQPAAAPTQRRRAADDHELGF